MVTKSWKLWVEQVFMISSSQLPSVSLWIFSQFRPHLLSPKSWNCVPAAFSLPSLPRPDMSSLHPVMSYLFDTHGTLPLSRTMLAFHLDINTCQYLSPSQLYPVISCPYFVLLENCATKYFSTFPSSVPFFLYIVSEPGRPFVLKFPSFSTLKNVTTSKECLPDSGLSTQNESKSS